MKAYIALAAVALLPLSAWAKDPAPYPVTIPVNAGDEKPELVTDVEYAFGGRVKLDAMFTHVSDADIATPGFPRDQYQATGIPVASSSANEESHDFFDYNAKGTIFFFKATAKVADHKLGTHVEMDFRVNPGAGSEVVTNAWNPGLRHAYLTYDEWLFGQTFSVFRNINAAPDTIESAGGAIESLVIVRQPQVRYTWAGLLGGDWQFSLENSETALTANGGASTRNVTGDSQLPDAVIRYDFKPGYGEFATAVLLRQLRADNFAVAPVAANGSTTGYGLMLSGKLPAFGGDDLRFNLMGGSGIGRYTTAATIDDAVIRADGSLEAIDVVSGYAVYRHPWTPRWRSNLLLSGMLANNDTNATGLGVTRSVTGVHFNTIYSPVEKLSFGMQAIYAVREIEKPQSASDASGEHGSLSRLQFTAMYSF